MESEFWVEFPIDMKLSKYMISFNGYIYSKNYNIIMKLGISGGYYMIKLYDDNGNLQTYLVHRLVAMTFIPNPEDKPTVYHINRIGIDNNVHNLVWATYSEQIANRSLTGKHTSRKVKQILHNGILVKEWDSIKDVKKQLGFGIQHYLNGGSRHPIYDFKYADLDILEGEIF